jgi:hypothetical protein
MDMISRPNEHGHYWEDERIINENIKFVKDKRSDEIYIGTYNAIQISLKKPPLTPKRSMLVVVKSSSFLIKKELLNLPMKMMVENSITVVVALIASFILDTNLRKMAITPAK